ncbi:hypothetical protein AJ88_46790 [Mesorhizobium amorphae CCBAU 01583]|nr:hypothetical protein AJ88_46790 [Mesorhizobium amorphae CCBAU 01583]
MADVIGEGAWREELESGNNQAKFIGGIIWHLLGDDDAYVRWTVARSLATLADLGLIEEFNVLLDGFDQTEVAALVSSETRLSFQNSQQWFLMGLARASLFHAGKLRHLRPKLVALASGPTSMWCINSISPDVWSTFGTKGHRTWNSMRCERR